MYGTILCKLYQTFDNTDTIMNLLQTRTISMYVQTTKQQMYLFY